MLNNFQRCANFCSSEDSIGDAMMLVRYASFALLVAVLCTGPASAQNTGPAAAEKLTYLSRIIEMPQFIPPPPAPDSEAAKEDLDEVSIAQDNRTEEKLKKA